MGRPTVAEIDLDALRFNLGQLRSLTRGKADILGVEAPLWSETLLTLTDIEYMAFPRLIGIAEIGWSPQQGRSWDEYRLRLGAQAARLEALDVTFYHSPQVPWQ